VVERAVADAEIERLLHRVYVDGGFTPPEIAATAFVPAAVGARGQVLVVRDPDVVGMVIVVPPGSPAARLARADEAELHLLAVAPEARGKGVGAALVRAAIETARAPIVLWTQPAMVAAQRLYVAAGFVRAPERDARIAAISGRAFLVFERAN
jgi:ribosomal protein S18 acetylase RimI-like enzyme